MARSVEFRNNSDPSDHGISHQITNLVSCVDFFGTEGSILCNFGMLVKLEGERILIDNVPMHDAHLVVHESIHSLIEQVDGLIVTRGVHHESPPGESGLIFDVNGQLDHGAIGDVQFIARDRLIEGLKGMHESHIVISIDLCLILVDGDLVGLFSSRQSTLQAGVRHIDVHKIFEPDQLKVVFISNDSVSNVASKALILLVLNQLNEVFVIILRLVPLNGEQNTAGIFKLPLILVVQGAFNLLGHRQEVKFATFLRVIAGPVGQSKAQEAEECKKFATTHLIRLNYEISTSMAIQNNILDSNDQPFLCQN